MFAPRVPGPRGGPGPKFFYWWNLDSLQNRLQKTRSLYLFPVLRSNAPSQPASQPASQTALISSLFFQKWAKNWRKYHNYSDKNVIKISNRSLIFNLRLGWSIGIWMKQHENWKNTQINKMIRVFWRGKKCLLFFPDKDSLEGKIKENAFMKPMNWKAVTGVYRFWWCITFGESENKNESHFSN
jgi:hypothetical protein